MKKKYFALVSILLLFLLITGCTSPAQDVYEQTEDNLDTTAQIDTEKEKDRVKLENIEEYGVWYEIFVRSFADGDDDGIGDFTGLTNKLDYLNDGDPATEGDLGINGIWLMPMQASPSYHGYDVTDYYAVNPEYGTMEEFQTFLDEAHKRGISVIIDLVINHTSAEHPWFVSAKEDKASEYRDYYIWKTENDEGYNMKSRVWGHNIWNKVEDEYYYAIFWDQMPDLNYDNAAVRNEVKDIAKFWLEQGVDGFRMDAAMHIYGTGELPKGSDFYAKNMEWWEEFDQACKEVNPDYYLVGEVWTDIEERSKYTEPFKTTFNFDMGDILTIVKTGDDLKRVNNQFVNKLDTIYQTLEERDKNFIDAPFLTNHDQKRAMNHLNNDEEAMKLAAAMYMTLPGNPFIYYGEEIGMLGDKPDQLIREPFIWGDMDDAQTSWEEIAKNKETQPVEVQKRIPHSILNQYKTLIRLRQNNDALLKGEFEGIETESSKIIAYNRSTEQQSLFIIHNVGLEEITIKLSEIIGDREVQLVYSSSTLPYDGEAELIIPARTTLVFE